MEILEKSPNCIIYFFSGIILFFFWNHRDLPEYKYNILHLRKHMFHLKLSEL